MNRLQTIWTKRFQHYIVELQKYLKYVFTGHLMLVLVFTLGAGGYAYSEWLVTVSTDFPAALVVSAIISFALIYSAPVTLLKEADIVYFLPMEYKLKEYMNKAVNWSVLSQLPLPLILFIVTMPLLSATESGTPLIYGWILIFIVILKWLYVQTEYNYRVVKQGEVIWLNRFVHFSLAMLFFYLLLTPSFIESPFILVILILVVGQLSYSIHWKKRALTCPFPFEHFIRLEQNRMMRFYRFANYFTDVPHIKGSVSKRNWLSFFMKPGIGSKRNAQEYLIRRTFIRTDDLFWLWVRLTALSVIGAYFIAIPIASYLFIGALAFASTIQLLFALRKSDDFRMDMLFPVPAEVRVQAIKKQVLALQYIQAVLIGVSGFLIYGISLTPLLMSGVVILSSFITSNRAMNSQKNR